MCRTVVASLVLLVSLAGASHAQRGVIYGRISDAAGAPLTYSNVLLESTMFGAMTDASGRYAVEAPPGRYVVKAIAHEFEVDSKSGRLGRDDSVRIDFVLKKKLHVEPIREIRVRPEMVGPHVHIPDVVWLGATNMETRYPPGMDPNEELIPMDSVEIVYHTETTPVTNGSLEFKLRYEMTAVGDSVEVKVIAEARNVGQLPAPTCGCFSFWSTQFAMGHEEMKNIRFGPARKRTGPRLHVPPVECSSPTLDCVPETLIAGGTVSRAMSFFFHPSAFETTMYELRIRCFYFAGRGGTEWEDTERVDMGTIAVPLRAPSTTGRYTDF